MNLKSSFLLIILTLEFLSCSPKFQNKNIKQNSKIDSKIHADAIISKQKTSIDPKKELEKILLSKKIPVDPSFRIGILDNGMHYFIKKNHKPENRVEFRLVVNAGSILEDDDQKGLAHFIEHMQFNGSEHFSKNELINYLESVGTQFGADLNAYTSFDETVYKLQVRSDKQNQLDTGLLVMYDWVGKASFNSVEIDKERGVVISEWRTGLSPQQRMQNKYFPILFKGSKYAERLPIGDPEIIKNADYNTIKRFYKDWYRPDLMALIVVGDIDVDKMETKIKKMFSNFNNPDNERERIKFNIPPQKGTDIIILSDKEAPFTNVQIINKLPHKKLITKNDLLKSIERQLFNMMLNARLEEIINSPTPPFSFATTGYSNFLGNLDAYTSWAMVPEGKAIDAIKTFVRENQKVLKYGFSKSELERQKTNLLKSIESAYKEKDKTASGHYASNAVYYFLYNNPLLSEEQYYNFVNINLNKVSLKEINDLANEWISDDNRVIIVTYPEKEVSNTITKEEIETAIKDINNENIKAYIDKTTDKPLFDKKLTPSTIKETKKYNKFGIEKLVLQNGVEVYLKKTDFKNNEILFSAFSPGGTSLYNNEDYNEAKEAAKAIDEMGIANFNKTQLKKLLTGKDVSVKPYIGNLYENLRGSASIEDLETMFQLINLFFTAPRKDPEAFNSYITRSSGLYSNLIKNPQYFFIDKSIKIKYNNNPRSGGFPKSEDFNSLNLDKLYNIYKDRFSDAGDFKFFFVGNFDNGKIKMFIKKYLGNLPSNNRVEKGIDRNVEMLTGQTDTTIYYGEAPKTYVDITYHGHFDWNPDNEYVLKSLVNVLKIKLRESLREEKGGVYGVGVYGYASKEPKENYMINISFNSDPDNTDNLINAANEVISKLKSQGPDDEVIKKVTETQKQSRTKNVKENKYWLSKISSSVQRNLDFSELTLETLESRISNLDKDKIKNAAKKYLNNNNKIKIVMYPQSYKKDN